LGGGKKDLKSLVHAIAVKEGEGKRKRGTYRSTVLCWGGGRGQKEILYSTGPGKKKKTKPRFFFQGGRKRGTDRGEIWGAGCGGGEAEQAGADSFT